MDFTNLSARWRGSIGVVRPYADYFTRTARALTLVETLSVLALTALLLGGAVGVFNAQIEKRQVAQELEERLREAHTVYNRMYLTPPRTTYFCDSSALAASEHTADFGRCTGGVVAARVRLCDASIPSDELRDPNDRVIPMPEWDAAVWRFVLLPGRQRGYLEYTSRAGRTERFDFFPEHLSPPGDARVGLRQDDAMTGHPSDFEMHISDAINLRGLPAGTMLLRGTNYPKNCMEALQSL